MKIELIIDEEQEKIDILYSGYNIISKTIYNGETVQNIIDLLQSEIHEDLHEITDINKR